MRKTCTTNLSDEEWVRLKSHLPASKLPGRLRAHSLRDILDAIFYVLRSDCPWRMLPGNLLLREIQELGYGVSYDAVA